ncbi:hypothetical protein GJ496_004670 [Pomphorhynchus laevis]|nr:hypothetical protein GJ496_006663 [Pomphorhynchus laevis]KAI0990166.1 hypothetical protein GJ496_004670 [Pomphorhynchus laevis]
MQTRQNLISKHLDDKSFQQLLQNANTYDSARLRGLACPHAYAWLHTIPNLAAPITLRITRERDTASHNARARFNLTRGYDLLMEYIKDDDFFLTTGYTTVVLCAISQNCWVEAWNRPQFVIFDSEQREYMLPRAESVEPALVYDTASRLVVVGTIWHYDWYMQQGFGLRLDCNQLPPRVRILIKYKATHLLLAGVSATGDDVIFTLAGKPSNLAKHDVFHLDYVPNKRIKQDEKKIN